MPAGLVTGLNIQIQTYRQPLTLKPTILVTLLTTAPPLHNNYAFLYFFCYLCNQKLIPSTSFTQYLSFMMKWWNLIFFFLLLLVSSQCWGTAMRSALFTDSPWLTAPSSQHTLRANWSDLQQQMNHSYTCPSMSCRGTTHSFFSFVSTTRDPVPFMFQWLVVLQKRRYVAFFTQEILSFLLWNISFRFKIVNVRFSAKVYLVLIPTKKHWQLVVNV